MPRSSTIHANLIVAFATATMFTRTRLNARMQYTALIVVFLIEGSLHKSDNDVQTTRTSLYVRSYGVATNSTRSEELDRKLLVP